MYKDIKIDIKKGGIGIRCDFCGDKSESFVIASGKKASGKKSVKFCWRCLRDLCQYCRR